MLVVMGIDGDRGDVSARADIGDEIIGGAKEVHRRPAAEKHAPGTERRRARLRRLHRAHPKLIDAGCGERRDLRNARGQAGDRR